MHGKHISQTLQDAKDRKKSTTKQTQQRHETEILPGLKQGIPGISTILQ